MDGKLLSVLFLINATYAAGKVVSLSCQQSLFLPRTMYASKLRKWALLIVPMSLRIPIVKSFETITHFLFCFWRTRLTLTWVFSVARLQFSRTSTRARMPLGSMTRFDEIGRTAILASLFNWPRQTLPRAKARLAYGLIYGKYFSASFARFFDLLEAAFSPAFTSAIFLLRFCGRDLERLSAHGAISNSHSVSIA